MSKRKQRLTVTVDPGLIAAGNAAVAAGQADSLSAWVNVALEERVQTERRRRALSGAIELYEAELGEVTEAEMEAQRRADRRRAVVVRGRKRRNQTSKKD
jgi:hypothetical protein